MESSFRPSIDELNNFVAASIALGAALTAFSGSFNFMDAAFYLAVGSGVILLRELGQRTIAQWQEAYVELELSIEGTFTTFLGAAIAAISGLPVLLPFPVFNQFSGRSYEHWGKTIDAVWMKRQFWIVMGGIITLLLGWAVFLALGLTRVAEPIILFTVFQMLPFDYEGIPTGALDGAYILRWSGFLWIVLFGIGLLGTVLTV